MSGSIKSNINVDITNVIPGTNALQTALSSINATEYFWENQEEENLLKLIKNDSSASYYPVGELQIYKQSNLTKIVYNFKISSNLPYNHHIVLVDAISNEVILNTSGIRTCANDTACTALYGNQTIGQNFNSTNNKYELFNDCMPQANIYIRHNPTNGGLPTLVNNSTPNWGCNEGHLTGLMWDAQQTLEFFDTEFSWLSYGNNNEDLNISVNYNSALNNAEYRGGGLLIFGSKASSLETFVHEFSHGISESVHLGISNIESASLDESFADIFGVYLQFKIYPTLNPPILTNWLFDDENSLSAGANYSYVRNMQDPKDLNPIGLGAQVIGEHTYSSNINIPAGANLGSYADIYAGVQNYWFYLLCEGGSGINDNQESYSIAPIGIDKAVKVAFKNLTTQLNNGATFLDSRIGSLVAANELYQQGILTLCDIESVKAAWDAVGVYGVSSSANETLISGSVPKYGVNETITENIRIQSGGALTINNYSVMNFAPGVKIILEQNSSLIIKNSTLKTSTAPLQNCSNQSRWGGIDIVGNNVSLHIDKTEIIEAFNAINIGDYNNIDLTITQSDFEDCKIAIKNECNSSANNFTIEHCIFKNTDLNSIEPNFLSVSSVPQPLTSVYGFLPQSLASAGISPGSLFNTNIGVGYKNIDVTKNRNIGIKNLGYMNISNCWFINLDKGITGEIKGNGVIENVNTNYFFECNTGVEIVDDALGLYNSLTLNNNRFNKNTTSIKIKNIGDLDLTDNIIRNMPIATTNNTYGVDIDNISSLSFDNNRIYGVNSYNNKTIGLNIKNLVSDINIQNSRFDGIDKAVEISNSSHQGVEKLIENNNFINLNQGLVTDVNGLNIQSNTFDNNKKGIYTTNATNITNENRFINIPKALDDNNPNTIDDTYGVFLAGGSFNQDNEISNNIFEGYTTSSSITPNTLHSYGVIAEDIYFTGAKTSLFQNKFEGLDIGIQTQGNNNALIVKCNEFGVNNNPQLLTGLYVFDQINDMGDACDDGIASTPNDNLQAGNEWMDLCPENSGLINDILVDGAASPFNYWAHSKNALSNEETTIPWCNSQNFTLEICRLSSGNDEITKDVNSCTSAFAGWQRPAPNDDDGLNDLLVEYIGDRDVLILELNDLQIQLTEPEIQNTLVREIKDTYVKIDKYNFEIAEIYKKKDDEIGFKNFMESTESAQSKLELAQHYIEKEEYALAQQALQEVILYNRPSYLYKDINTELMVNLNKEYLANIKNLEINLKESNRTKMELADDEIIMLQEIKAAHVPVSTLAENWLGLYGEEIPHHPIKKGNGIDINNNENNFDFQLTIMPNPSTTSASVLFSMPPNAKDAQIILFDQYQQMGNQLQTYTPDKLSNTVLINTSNLNTGIYLVYLQVDGVGVASEQLIVIH